LLRHLSAASLGTESLAPYVDFNLALYCTVLLQVADIAALLGGSAAAAAAEAGGAAPERAKEVLQQVLAARKQVGHGSAGKQNSHCYGATRQEQGYAVACSSARWQPAAAAEAAAVAA
jgi:hypothetical protein